MEVGDRDHAAERSRPRRPVAVAVGAQAAKAPELLRVLRGRGLDGELIAGAHANATQEGLFALDLQHMGPATVRVPERPLGGRDRRQAGEDRGRRLARRARGLGDQRHHAGADPEDHHAYERYQHDNGRDGATGRLDARDRLGLRRFALAVDPPAVAAGDEPALIWRWKGRAAPGTHPALHHRHTPRPLNASTAREYRVRWLRPACPELRGRAPARRRRSCQGKRGVCPRAARARGWRWPVGRHGRG